MTKQTSGLLQVTATPKSQVYLDSQLIGQTPLPATNINPGEHTVKIIPVENQLNSSFNQKLNFKPRLLTAIDMTFGETDTQSEGSVLELEPISNKKTSELTILSTPAETTILLDGELKGITPLQIKDVTPSDHEIMFEKAGIQSKKVRVKTSAGYKLIANVRLALLEQQVVSSPSATPTPKQETIVIKQTPTGFLRVRFAPTLVSTEVARVKPGETFPLVEEGEGWIKILLPNNLSGWVSSQYVVKP